MRLPLPALLLAGLLGALLASACGGGSADNQHIASIIHRLLVSANTSDTGKLESFTGRLPDGLPAKPPEYPGASLVVSSRRSAATTGSTPQPAATSVPQPELYFIVYDTGDDRQQVLDFYEKALDQKPWQLESAFSTAELDSLQFSNSDDADISGVISIARGGDDKRTSILVSLQDAGAFRQQLPPFQPAKSLPLPNGFPPDLPIYKDANITSNAFLRQPGNNSYLVDFLTTASQDDVIAFYRQTFADKGWTVLPGAPLGVQQRLDFHDAQSDIQGSLLADAFPADSRYVEVKLQVQVNPARTPVSVVTPNATPGTGTPPAPTKTSTPPAPTGTPVR
jgi:hypothetical protein